MSRLLASLAALLLFGGCAMQPRDKAATPAARSPLEVDMQCVDDCLGNGGNRQFCEERCSN